MSARTKTDGKSRAGKVKAEEVVPSIREQREALAELTREAACMMGQDPRRPRDHWRRLNEVATGHGYANWTEMRRKVAPFTIADEDRVVLADGKGVGNRERRHEITMHPSYASYLEWLLCDVAGEEAVLLSFEVEDGSPDGEDNPGKLIKFRELCDTDEPDLLGRRAMEGWACIVAAPRCEVMSRAAFYALTAMAADLPGKLSANRSGWTRAASAMSWPLEQQMYYGEPGYDEDYVCPFGLAYRHWRAVVGSVTLPEGEWRDKAAARLAADGPAMALSPKDENMLYRYAMRCLSNSRSRNVGKSLEQHDDFIAMLDAWQMRKPFEPCGGGAETAKDAARAKDAKDIKAMRLPRGFAATV